MNLDYFKYYNFNLNTSKFFINLTQTQINKIKNLIDNSLSGDIQDMTWRPEGYKEIEKNADIYLAIIPDNSWSLLFCNDFFNYFLLIILSLPLMFSLYILFFFLKNSVNSTIRGKISMLEDKEVNFTVLYKDYWRVMWAYAYDLVPRYYKDIEITKSEFRKLGKFPNPNASLIMFRHLFINNNYPLFLVHFIFIFMLITLFLYQDFSLLIVLFLCYLVAAHFDWKKFTKRWSLGLHYHWRIIVNLKKKIKSREDLHEVFFFWSRLSFYPVLFSFILFFFSTILVIIMYLDFFFNPILVWNGYFANTIVCFFLTASPNLFKNNPPIILDYFIALDGLNVWLIWLTSLLVFLCSLYLLDSTKLHSFIAQLGWIYLLAFASFQFFCVPNYLWMYIYFELSLLPIFILIVFWGSNRRKIHAAYQMVLFTFIGSMFLLVGIFMLFIKIRSFNCFDIFFVTQSPSLSNVFSNFEKKIIWVFLFLGFAVKTPLYPFHIWLPEAHSEAPTTGSVMLAGVLLKMGTYGFLRFVMPLFPSVLETFKTLIFTMCLSGVLLSSLAALAQIDIKKIIAYSSIGHMGLVIIGIYNLNMNGLLGASYMMLSHGLVSSALFFSIGLLYKIYGTRSIIYYNSIAHFMPRFSMCFFFFSLANMSFPGTAGFPGELLIFASMMESNFFIAILLGVGSILGGVYSIWLLTRVLYGQISPKISIYWDLKASERKILNFLLILILIFGVFPFFLIDFFKPMCSFLLLTIK